MISRTFFRRALQQKATKSLHEIRKSIPRRRWIGVLMRKVLTAARQTHNSLMTTKEPFSDADLIFKARLAEQAERYDGLDDSCAFCCALFFFFFFSTPSCSLAHFFFEKIHLLSQKCLNS